MYIRSRLSVRRTQAQFVMRDQTDSLLHGPYYFLGLEHPQQKYFFFRLLRGTPDFLFFSTQSSISSILSLVESSIENPRGSDP